MFEFKATPKPVNLLNSKKTTLSTNIMPPLEKERHYVHKEEQKAKERILAKKIEDFRAKKTMNPYDLKIESKFRVQPNLSFFLNDQKTLAAEEKKTAHVQTDMFKKKMTGINVSTTVKKNGNNIGHVEKKTGKDEGVQVDLDELFDYDKAVKPIVGVLVTKIIEQSLLEVEEEIEIANMLKFKDEYYNKRLVNEQTELTEFIHKEKTKMNVFNDKCRKNQVDNENNRIGEVNTMIRTCIDDVINVVYRIINTIDNEKLANTKDERLVTYEREGLKILSTKLDAKIERKAQYDSLFDRFINNKEFIGMKGFIANNVGYERYLDSINILSKN